MADAIRIDKNIPLPHPKPDRYGKYPLGQMGVGESFAVPEAEVLKVRPAVAHYARRTGKQFTTRKIVEHGKTVIRVWRTA